MPVRFYCFSIEKAIPIYEKKLPASKMVRRLKINSASCGQQNTHVFFLVYNTTGHVVI